MLAPTFSLAPGDGRIRDHGMANGTSSSHATDASGTLVMDYTTDFPELPVGDVANNGHVAPAPSWPRRVQR
jgi:hypothetical protein